VTKTAQVANAMRRLIAEGYWAVGESVGDLGKLEASSEKLFGVKASFGTIRAAEQILVDEGILSTIKAGMPTRVVAVPSLPDPKPSMAELRFVYARLGEAYAKLGEVLRAAGAGTA
jgi:hypothetical protein